MSPPVDAYHDPEPRRSNKAEKRRPNSHANRRYKWQDARAQQDRDSLLYPQQPQSHSEIGDHHDLLRYKRDTLRVIGISCASR